MVKILIHATKPEDGQTTCCPMHWAVKKCFWEKKSHMTHLSLWLDDKSQNGQGTISRVLIWVKKRVNGTHQLARYLCRAKRAILVKKCPTSKLVTPKVDFWEIFFTRFMEINFSSFQLCWQDSAENIKVVDTKYVNVNFPYLQDK